MKIKRFKAIKGGEVSGKGKDDIGEFTIKGRMHAGGEVDFTK